MAEQDHDSLPTASADIEMKEETPAEEPSNSLHLIAAPAHPQPAPHSMLSNASTPPAGSASSARPGSQTPVVSAKPEKPVAHGGPTRQYLNANVTPHLLEGMKYLAIHEPEQPLLWLADFLREKSLEIEGAKEKGQS